jgi:hypothetical protein
MHPMLTHQVVADKYTYKKDFHFDTPVDSQPSGINEFTPFHESGLQALTRKTNLTTNHQSMDPSAIPHFLEAFGDGDMPDFISSSTAYHWVQAIISGRC